MSTLYDLVSYFRPSLKSEERKSSGIPSFSEDASCGLSCNVLHSNQSPTCIKNLNEPDYNIKDVEGSPTEVHRVSDLLEHLEPPKIQRWVLPLDSLKEEKGSIDILGFDISDGDQTPNMCKLFPKPMLSSSLDSNLDEENHNDIYHDDSTVVVSNRAFVDSTNDEKYTCIQAHCGLKHVFHIHLSAPFELPKCNSSDKMNAYIRRGFSRGRYSKNNSARSMNAIPDNRKSFSRKLSKTSYQINPILQDQQQKILIGTLLKRYSFKKSSIVLRYLQRIQNKFPNGFQNSDARDKFEDLLSKKSAYLINKKLGIKKRQKGILKNQVLVTSQHTTHAHIESWSELDDAVKGRLDGIDVLFLGSAKKIIRTSSDQRCLDFRKIVQESLWISCGRKPSGIIFEGLTGIGKGSDRWSATINRVDDYSSGENYEAHLNPDCCSMGVEGKPYQQISISVNSLEDLQQSYDQAVEPLIFGDIKRSIVIMNKILVSVQKLFNDPKKAHHTIGSTHHNIASLHLLDGNFDQALIHMNKAISTRIRSLGFNHESTSVSLAKLGLIYIGLNRLNDALDAFQEALNMRLLDDTVNQLDVAKLLNNIGVIYYLQHRKKLAIRFFVEAVRIENHYMDRSLCRDCIKYDIVVSLSNMAKTYLDRKKHHMSAFLYEEALEHQLSILDKDHMDVLDTLDNIAFVKLDGGDKTNAMTIYKSLYKLQVATLGNDSLKAINTLCMMSFIMIQLSNYTVALRYLTEVLQMQMEVLGQNDTRVKNTQSIIANLQQTIQGTI